MAVHPTYLSLQNVATESWCDAHSAAVLHGDLVGAAVCLGALERMFCLLGAR